VTLITTVDDTSVIQRYICFFRQLSISFIEDTHDNQTLK